MHCLVVALICRDICMVTHSLTQPHTQTYMIQPSAGVAPVYQSGHIRIKHWNIVNNQVGRIWFFSLRKSTLN